MEWCPKGLDLRVKLLKGQVRLVAFGTDPSVDIADLAVEQDDLRKDSLAHFERCALCIEVDMKDLTFSELRRIGSGEMSLDEANVIIAIYG